MFAPLVSVIIPNYNHSSYLEERINSVLNQSYDNIEVIILDDKSTDNSVEIIKRYANHPKVKQVLVNKENSGSTFIQWSKGFNLSKGDYIWIAESDDVAHVDFLKEMVNAINADESVVLALSKIQIIDEKGEKGKIIGASHATKIRKRSGRNFINCSLFLGNRLFNASSMIFKKSSLDYIDDKYKSLKSSGDYMFYVELATTGNVVEVPIILDYFRRHDATVTPHSNASGETCENDFVVYKKLQELGIAKGIKKNVLVGFRLWQIDRCYRFSNNQIKEKVHDLWASEVNSIIMSKLLYQIYRVYHRIIY